MTVREIIANYLKQNGFDGLCGDMCGCGFADDDLFHLGGECCLDCVPGYRRNVNSDCLKCELFGECDVGHDAMEYVYCARKKLK